MEQQGINDANVRTDQKVSDKGIVKLSGTEIQANTPSGASWARKYEHPPAPTPPDYAGIPDINGSPSVRTEYRAVQNIQCYKQTDTKVTNFNEIAFLQIGSMTVPVFAWKYDTAGNRVQFPEDVVHNQGIGAREHLSNFISGRLAYKSVTYSLNANDFNNQGVVTVAQFRPNICRFTYENLAMYVCNKLPKQKALAFLKTLKPPSERVDGFVDVDPKITEGVGNSYVVLTVGKIPNSSTDVAQLSPNATVSPAKEGAFVVQRFSQPINEYRDYATGKVTREKPFPVYGSQVLIETIQDGVANFLIVNDYYYTSTGTTVMEDIDLFDFTCAWVHFEGLSVQPASTTATTVTPPYITVKAITGIEAQALPNSMFTPFMANSAIYDSKALEFSSMITHARQDSLPARFNFWGALGSALLTAAPSIVSTVKGLFGKKETQQEKNITKDSVDKLSGMLKKSMRNMGNKPPKKQNRPNPPRRREMNVYNSSFQPPSGWSQHAGTPKSNNSNGRPKNNNGRKRKSNKKTPQFAF